MRVSLFKTLWKLDVFTIIEIVETETIYNGVIAHMPRHIYKDRVVISAEFTDEKVILYVETERRE